MWPVFIKPPRLQSVHLTGHDSKMFGGRQQQNAIDAAKNYAILRNMKGSSHSRLRETDAEVLQTSSDVIEALGGNRVVAEWLELRPETVSGWRRRGFPAQLMPKISSRCESKNLQFAAHLFEPRPHGNRRVWWSSGKN